MARALSSLYSTGVGAKRGRDEDWIDQQESFDSILAELNAEQTRGGVAAEGDEEGGEEGQEKGACPELH